MFLHTCFYSVVPSLRFSSSIIANTDNLVTVFNHFLGQIDHLEEQSDGACQDAKPVTAIKGGYFICTRLREA